MTGEWKKYRRTNIAEMRPYRSGEDLTGVSVSDADRPGMGGMIARNPKNHDDQWYVATEYFRENFVTLDGEAVDRHAAAEAVAELGRVMRRVADALGIEDDSAPPDTGRERPNED